MNAICEHDDNVWCIWCIEDGQHLPAGSVIEASCKKRQPALCAFEVCSCLQEQRLILKGIKDVKPHEDSIYLYDPACDCARCKKRRKKMPMTATEVRRRTEAYVRSPAVEVLGDVRKLNDELRYAILCSMFLPRKAKKKSLLQRLKGFFK